MIFRLNFLVLCVCLPVLFGAETVETRKGNYKLLELVDDQGVRLELYDPAADIGEEHNLAPDMPERMKEMKILLDKWQAGVDARMPTEIIKSIQLLGIWSTPMLCPILT